MNQDISIWSPVIITRLPDYRNYQQYGRYPIDEAFQSIDDIRLKIKDTRVHIHGKAVEAIVYLELLCLLQDSRGRSRLINKQETLKDKVSLLDFDPPLQDEQNINYIIDIDDIYWDGEMKNNELFITYYLNYMLMAVHEQVVNLSREEGKETTVIYEDEMQDTYIIETNKEMERIRNENQMLRRKVSFFERDIISLRRGIKKVENRNAVLNRNVSQYEDLVKQLREAINNKNIIICKYEDQLNQATAMGDSLSNPGEDYKLGRMIKRMFMNSL